MLKIALVKNSMDPKSDLGMARCSRPAKKMGLEVAGLAMRVVLISCSVPSWLFSLAPTLWAVEKPDPWESCRLLEPLPARGARRAPGQKPTHSKPSKSELEPKASTSLTPSKTIKNDHPKSEPTRGAPKTITQNPSRPEGHKKKIKNVLFTTGPIAKPSPATELLL